MVETSCDLYITVQSEELSSIIDKYAIHEKGDGRMEYFHDFHTYRFYAIYIDQNDLYNAIPSSDWLLTASVVKWINEIVADIPAEGRTAFTNCIDRANFIEMIVNFRSLDDDDDSEFFRGVKQDGKYRFSKKKRSEYLPSLPPIDNKATLSGANEPCYASEDFKAALDYVAKGERALALDTYQFSKRLCFNDYMLYGLKSDGTLLSEEFIKYGLVGNPSIKRWKDITMLASMWHPIFGLKADGTVISAGCVNWDEREKKRWTNISSILTTDRHIIGQKKDGTCIAYGFQGVNHTSQCAILLSDDWHEIESIVNIGDALYGLRKDGVVVGACNEDGYKCNWANIKSIHTSYSKAGGVLVGLTKNGDIVTHGQLQDALIEMSTWHNIVSLYPNYLACYGVKYDGTVIMAGPNTKGHESVNNWTDIIALAPNNNILGLKKDGSVVSAGCLRQNVLIGPIKSNPTAHLKNIVSMYLINNNTFVVALAADGTVNTANTELGKTTSILNSWKLW